MFNLETAQSPHKLRRVAIEPVSRVEGHGKVTILLDGEDRIHQVRLHIVEFRGFEIFIEGRPFWEVPVAVQRLCGICPVSHLLAATKAMDLIAGYGPLTPTAEKLRRLLHYGQIMQSHALHFFHLSSPDLLLGFESEVAKRNIVGVAAAFPDLAKQGVLTRKFGQEVIRACRGKAHSWHRRHSRRREQAAQRRRPRFDACRHRPDRPLVEGGGRSGDQAARDEP